MDWKIMFGLACASALGLGACSSNIAPGPTGGGQAGTETGTGTEIGTDTGSGSNGVNGGSSGTEPTAKEKANTAYSAAERAVSLAIAAADAAVTADTAAARKAADMAIADARAKLADAVIAAETAVAVAAAEGEGNAAVVGVAARALSKASSFRTAQAIVLDDALASFAWFGRRLVRSAIPINMVEVPSEYTNTVTIVRTPRTKDKSEDDDAQIPNPAAIYGTPFGAAPTESDTFKDVLYQGGKRVFSLGGDEFKVNGYVTQLASIQPFEENIYTGIKLTSNGLTIRVGGTRYPPPISTENTYTDYTDMRRDITKSVRAHENLPFNRHNAPNGQNGWDLAITFDEPQTTSVTGGVTSWTGNGDFYWKSIVPADPSQLSVDGDYYNADAFKQPDGYKNLGTYEVWLSNLHTMDENLEPSGSGSYPEDDEPHYLKYAAYGLFVYTADSDTFQDETYPNNGQIGRVQTLSFGYSAFANAEGRKTTDINSTITSGSFVGQTLAIAVRGAPEFAVDSDNDPGTGIDTKLLRGDVSLTVTIPKTTGAGTLIGEISNFEEWTGRYWQDYIADFRVALDNSLSQPVTIGDDGSFNGQARVEPADVRNGDVYFASSGYGVFKGSFYGPRTDSNDLEVAGSWAIANGYVTDWAYFGGFGAKQRPGASSEN